MTRKRRVYRPMTQRAFLAWFRWHGGDVLVGPPAVAVPCDCGDINCRGWRFVRDAA
jgi:hypothetical protein